MIAAFILASGLAMQGIPDKPALPPTEGQLADQARFKVCAQMVEDDPETAYEQAKAWERETRAPEASRCAALAMIARGDPEIGAKQLEQLAQGKAAIDTVTRASLLIEAGNAFMLAHKPLDAVVALTAALKLAPRTPDTLIDRARAYGLGGQWKLAEDDLNAALDIRPKDSYALALRGEARLKQNVLDLALKDAESALALEPKNEIAALVRGQAIEAKRTGKPAG